MTSEDRTDAYEETLDRTTAEPVTDPAREELGPSREIVGGEIHSKTDTYDSVSVKAKEAGKSLKDLVYSLGKKTKEATEGKARELKAQSVDIGIPSDARDIHALGIHVDGLLSVFEDTMTEIRREPYPEQEKLLLGYRKLLEEQIQVIEARYDMARRLKPKA